MFGRRSDGKKIKNVDPYQKIMPHLMSERDDSQNMYKIPVDCGNLDAFIQAQREEKGVSFSYMNILAACVVRLLASRPQLNRFIMNGRIFKRDGIYISLAIKRSLKDEGQSTTVKVRFDGTEDIYTVKQRMDDTIAENIRVSTVNDTDKTAKALTNMPNFLIKMGIGLLKWADRHGMMPKSVLHASPFHTSCFITNLKSIKIDYIYHHLYNFGTTSLFLAMGKEQWEPVINEAREIVPAKIMKIGVVTDERFCDGLYYGNSLRMLQKFLKNPALLTEPLAETVKDAD